MMACAGNRNQKYRWGICASLMLIALAGCSHEPAIAKGNLKLIGGLKTAIGAKKTDWLDAAAKHIEENRQQGKLSEAEYAVLEPIVADARKGQWDNAKAKLTHLINAQRGP